MKTALVVLAAALGAALLLFGLDRALLGLEARGWIYYRKKRGHVDRLGDAALRLQAMLEPGERHVVEEKERPSREEHDPAAPPD